MTVPRIAILPQPTETLASASGVAHTANSFSPAAGAQVRVCATWLSSTSITGKTFTCKDSNNVSYTATVIGSTSGGSCNLLVFDHVYATAPGPITLTITCSNTAAANCLVQLYLITGQSSNQSTAAKNSIASGSSTNTCEISLTTTKPGSLVFVLGTPSNANQPISTPISGTKTDSEWDDNSAGAYGVIGHSTVSTRIPGSQTFGWTLNVSAPNGFAAVAAEVIPAASVSGPYIPVLVDNFDDNSLDTSIWATPAGTSGITESNQKLNLADTTGFPAIVGMGNFDLETGILALKYYPTGSPSTDANGNGTNFHIGVQDGPGNTASLKAWANGDPLVGVAAVGATITTVLGDSSAFFAPNWTPGDWLGIGNIDASNKVHVYKSVDGQTWIEIASFVIGGTFNKSICGVKIYSGHNTGTSTFVTTFDDATRFVVKVQTVIDHFDGSSVDTNTWDIPRGIDQTTQTIIDNFDDNVFSTATWDVSGGVAADITESNGKLQVAATNNYTNVSSPETFDITNGFFAAQVSHVGIIDNVAAFLWFGIEDGDTTNAWAVQAYLAADTWQGYNQLGTVGAITGDQTAFSDEWIDGNWLGWGDIGPDNIMHIYKSADAETWTEIASVAYSGGSPNLASCGMTIGAAEDSGTTTYKAQFDNASYFANVPDIIESGGKLAISSVPQYPGLSSKKYFDITNGFLAVKVSQSGTPISSSQVFIGLKDSDGNSIHYLNNPQGAGFFRWEASGGLATVTGSTVTSGLNAAWNPDDWFGIGMSGSVATAYKSSDGQTWTELGHCTVGGTFNKFAAGIELTCGNFGSVSSNYKVLFDDASYFASSLQAAKIRLGGAWVNAILKVRLGGAWVNATPKVRIAGSWVTPV